VAALVQRGVVRHMPTSPHAEVAKRALVNHAQGRCVNCVEVLKPRYIQHRMRRIAFESGAVTLEQLMSRGQKPLLLMMALSMPGTGNALGLGDIHVNSKLNEPLAADIDIVGGTADELIGLRASLANRETFQRFGFERPAFLSSTTFKVSQDSQGRPVLMVRSSESFTDPLVSILVDLNWGNGELVREYTLLLDPAGFGTNGAGAAIAPAPVAQTASPVTEAAPAAAMAATAAAATSTTAATITTAATTAARDADGTQGTERKVSRYKIGAKATLRGIAWRAGARSKSDLRRLMIAIFRANPSAFEGNINRLRLGAFVNIPSPAEVSAIPRAEANREIRLQMAAWHAAGKPAPTRALAAIAVPAIAVPDVAVPAAAVPAATAPAPTDMAAGMATQPAEIAASTALGQRVQSLEQSLDALQRELKSENETMRAVERQVRRSEESTPAPIADAAPVPVQSRSSVLAAVIAGVATLCAAIGAGYFAMLRRTKKLKAKGAPKAKTPSAVDRAIDRAERAERPAAAALPLEFYPRDSFAEGSDPAADSSPTAEMPAIAAATAGAHRGAPVVDDTRPLPVLTGPDAAPTVALPTVVMPAIAAASDTTAILPDRDVLDIFSDTHVNMPSALNEQPVMKERRTNLADVLRKAIERDPERDDLRLKLLELYFGAAATNRQGFLDVVQKFAQQRKVLPAGEWDRIATMGRQIVPDSPLFSDTADDEQMADCA
jgi:pilus assembly protein FimV